MMNERSQLVFCVSLMLFMHFLLPVTEMIPHASNSHLSITTGHHGSFFDSHDQGHVLILHELPEHTHEENEHDVEELSDPYTIEVVLAELNFSDYHLVVSKLPDTKKQTDHAAKIRAVIHT